MLALTVYLNIYVVTVVRVALHVKTKACLHQMPASAEIGCCMENEENVGATVGWLLIQQYTFSVILV